MISHPFPSWKSSAIILAMTKLASLSVFFPCYNEARNIRPTIEKALEVIPELARKFELIIVDDGSQDQTAAVAQKLAEQHPEVKVVSHPKNMGYGAALKTGIASSRYDWIFFTDGDQQFDLHELASFIPFTDGYKVIIGYRTNRAEGFARARNAYLFKLFIDILFRLHVKDIDCAFKLINRTVLEDILIESSGAFTSAEMLYKLKKHGVTFKQLPVTHHPRKWGTPTGNNPRVIIRAGYEALKLYSKIKLSSLR